jgi:hypothetical protein
MTFSADTARTLERCFRALSVWNYNIGKILCLVNSVSVLVDPGRGESEGDLTLHNHPLPLAKRSPGLIDSKISFSLNISLIITIKIHLPYRK